MKTKILHKWRKWKLKRKLACKSDYYCHFCLKEQKETKCLVAGPSVFICDECTQICADFVLREFERRTKHMADTIKGIEDNGGIPPVVMPQTQPAN